MSQEHHEKGTTKRGCRKGSRGGTPNNKNVVDDFLEEKARRIESFLLGEAKDSLKQQIAIGREVENVRRDGRYGEAAIPKLATRLKLSPKFLYRLGTRAAAFDDDEIAIAFELAEAKIYTLSTSALDELTAISDHAERIHLLERCIDNRWTVKKLRGEIRGEGPSRAKTTVGAIPWARLTAAAEALRQLLLKTAAESSASDWRSEGGEPASRTIWELSKVILQVAQSWEHHLQSGLEPAAASETQDDEELNWDVPA